MIRVFRLFLFPISVIYAFIMQVRYWFYEYGIFKKVSTNAKIISVGNLTVGGAGKTPTVIFLVEKLVKHGLKVAVIAKGYRGKITEPTQVKSHHTVNDVGDEARLFFQRLNVPIWIGKNKAQTALKADLSEKYDVLVVDDGFQHLRLHRHWDLLLIDATRPFWHYLPLPAGDAREVVDSIGRASHVIFSKTKYANAKWVRHIQSVTFGSPWSEANFEVKKIRSIHNQSELSINECQAHSWTVISAIARPIPLYKMLTDLGIKINSKHNFSDHYVWTENEWKALDQGQKILVTEKDAVKIGAFCSDNVYVVDVDWNWPEGENWIKRHVVIK